MLQLLTILYRDHRIEICRLRDIDKFSCDKRNNEVSNNSHSQNIHFLPCRQLQRDPIGSWDPWIIKKMSFVVVKYFTFSSSFLFHFFLDNLTAISNIKRPHWWVRKFVTYSFVYCGNSQIVEENTNCLNGPVKSQKYMIKWRTGLNGRECWQVCQSRVSRVETLRKTLRVGWCCSQITCVFH